MGKLTQFLLELHPLLCVEVPVENLLVLYECGTLGIGQFVAKMLRLQQIQEMQAVWVPRTAETGHCNGVTTLVSSRPQSFVSQALPLHPNKQISYVPYLLP